MNGCIQSETKFQYEEPEPIDNIKVVDDILGAISNKEIETILNIDVSELEDTLNKKEDFPIVSIDEIKRYLNMTEKELEGMTGGKIEKLQSLVIFETTLAFPVLFPENTSYWFVCTSWDTTCKPKYFSYYAAYEKEYLKQFGLENAVNFYDIIEVMGNAEIEASKTREEMEEVNITDYKNYKIEYERDGLQYVFIADNSEGENFVLYIGLAISD